MDVLNSLEDAGSPLHKIPLEVMDRIWAMCLHPQWSPDTVYRFRLGWMSDIGDAVALSSVCRRWRDLALCVPWMWADFTIGRMSQLKMLNVFLPRTQGAHLRYVLYPGMYALSDEKPFRSPWFHPMQKAMWQPALQLIHDNLIRTSSFQVAVSQVKDYEAVLAIFNNASMPVLRYLELQAPFECMHIPLKTDLFLASSGFPHRVYLTQPPDAWSSSIFSNLIEFQFEHRDSPTPSYLREPRVGDRQYYISPSKIAILLSVARRLAFLRIYQGFIVADDIPAGRPSFSTQLDYVTISSSMSNNAFDQLSDVICIEDVPNVSLSVVPLHGVPRLLSILDGNLELFLNSAFDGRLVEDTLVGNTQFFGPRDFGNWDITLFDEQDYCRDFSIGQERFATGTMLQTALGPVIDRVDMLHFYGGQWSQVSAGLRSVSLDHIVYLEILFVMDFAPHPHEAGSSPVKVDIPELIGTSLPMHALTHLFVCFAGSVPPPDGFFPLRITADHVKNLHKQLGEPQSMKFVKLYNVVPATDDADATIRNVAGELVYAAVDPGRDLFDIWWGSRGFFRGLFSMENH